MDPQSLTDSNSSNPLSTGSSDGGWKRVDGEGEGLGPTKNDVIPKSLKGLPRPRILTQRKNGANKTPININRKFIKKESYPENPIYPVYTGMGQPRSQGVGQYYYAPGSGNLTKDSAFRSGLVLGRVGRSGGEGAMVSEVGGREEQGTDSDLMVELGPDGYARYDSDSNFTQRPKTWRFKKRDRDVSMFPQKNQTSSPEAPSQFDVGNESLFYPLQGALPKGYEFGDPSPVGHYAQGDTEVIFQVPVWGIVDGKKDGPEPIFDLRFWLYENKRSPGKVYLNDDLPIQMYLYPAGKAAFPTEPEIDYEKNRVASKIRKNIPNEVMTKAAKEMGFEYQGEATKAERQENSVAKLPETLDATWTPEKFEELEKKVKGLGSRKTDQYIGGVARDILKQLGGKLPDIQVEDISRYLKERLVTREADAPRETKPGIPNFKNVTIDTLGKYMYSDHRKLYEALGESEKAQVLKLAREELGDARGNKISKETIRETLGDAIGAATVEIPKAQTGRGKKPMPTDLEPQERLFRNVSEWNDNYQVYTGSDISDEVKQVLSKKPEGSGKYFQWEYGEPSEGQEATLVIVRKQPWEEFQSAA